jgi:hypothetical protein
MNTMMRVDSARDLSDTGSVSSISAGSDSAPTRKDRIPRTLQGVFLASNRGKEVFVPPPNSAANKTFFRNWFKGAFPWSKRNAAKRAAARRGAGTVATRAETITEDKASLPPISQILAIKATPIPRAKPAPLPISPQAYLDAMIRKRGYLTRRYKTLTTGYYNKPTELQKASYHIHLIGLARSEDEEGFRAVMAAGISPNPCNQHGESLVHTIARKGSHGLLKIMLECGTSVQVSDDYGRTPLHDACWASSPSFETVKLILKRDMRMLHMTDARDAVPLSYVHKEDWKTWIEFLDAHKDELWPRRDVSKEGEQEDPPLALLEPGYCPLPDPVNALTPGLAGLVACGKMSPREAAMMLEDDSSDEEDSDDDSEDDSEYGSEDDSDYDSDSDSDFDEEEMALMAQMPTRRQ